eukprot:9243216-Pyramimonas_sp.AAC.1
MTMFLEPNAHRLFVYVPRAVVVPQHDHVPGAERASPRGDLLRQVAEVATAAPLRRGPAPRQNVAVRIGAGGPVLPGAVPLLQPARRPP